MEMQREAGKGQTNFHLFVGRVNPQFHGQGSGFITQLRNNKKKTASFRQFRVEEESLKLILTSHPTVTWNFNLQSLLLNRTDVFDQNLCKLSWGLSFRPLL